MKKKLPIRIKIAAIAGISVIVLPVLMVIFVIMPLYSAANLNNPAPDINNKLQNAQTFINVLEIIVPIIMFIGVVAVTLEIIQRREK